MVAMMLAALTAIVLRVHCKLVGSANYDSNLPFTLISLQINHPITSICFQASCPFVQFSQEAFAAVGSARLKGAKPISSNHHKTSHLDARASSLDRPHELAIFFFWNIWGRVYIWTSMWRVVAYSIFGYEWLICSFCTSSFDFFDASTIKSNFLEEKCQISKINF